MLTEPQTIYLAPHGLDTNSGTKEQPLASLTGARDVIRKVHTSDSVLVKIAPGEYVMTAPLELTEEDSAPIIFEGMGEATFYGGIPVKGFEKVSDQLWRAPIPAPYNRLFFFEQLYVNGESDVVLISTRGHTCWPWPLLIQGPRPAFANCNAPSNNP